MSPKDFFTVGLKLIGVYCLALAIRAWFVVFPAELIRTGQLESVTAILKLPGWISTIVPALMMVLGLYLLRDGKYVHELAFRNDIGADEGEPEESFTVGIMLYGLYLIVLALPNCIEVISNLFVVLQAPAYLSTDMVMDRLKSELLPTLATVGLGLFCFLNGTAFTRLAFHQRSV
jgi:hypothetical protein